MLDHESRQRLQRLQGGRTHRFFEEWWLATAGCSLEEKGAYADICAHVVQSGKPLSDEFGKRLLGLRKWKRLRDALRLRDLIEVDREGNVLPKVLKSRLYKTGYLYKKEPISAELRWKVFLRDGHQCVHCGKRTDLTADHIIPEIDGGETVIENLQTLCRSCNGKKGARP